MRMELHASSKKMDDVKCEGCNCIGKTRCGCEPLNKKHMCALDDAGFCYCCNAIGVDANKRRLAGIDIDGSD